MLRQGLSPSDHATAVTPLIPATILVRRCGSSLLYMIMSGPGDPKVVVVLDIEQGLATGQPVDRRVGDPAVDDPLWASTWGSDRDVPADLLVTPLTAAGGEARVPHRLQLAGARIVGPLSLASTVLTRGLRLPGAC
jgi:hypothetical protein